MPWIQEGSAAVVVARRFNVTAARQHWLVKQGIIGENDLLEGALFSDTVVQAPTSRFVVLLLPDQLQFVPTVSPDEEQPIILEKLGKIVGALPHVPYKALGLNFNWLFKPADGDTAKVTREMFFVQDRPLFSIFSGPDARFGGYLSKDHGEFRLKLNVTPMTLPQEGERSNVCALPLTSTAMWRGTMLPPTSCGAWRAGTSCEPRRSASSKRWEEG